MKKIVFLVIGVILIIIGIIFAYKYIYVPNGQEFDIKYTNLLRSNVKGSVEESKVELTKHGLATRTTFTKSGDAVDYSFDVINDGTINAKLFTNPIKLKKDMYFKKHIIYTIKYSDGNDVKKGDELKTGETKTIKVHIEYKQSSDFATMDSQFYESEIYLPYFQNR